MDNPNLYGRPIQSLQTMLREISFHYSSVPRVIPDGNFNPQTRDSVMGFQQQFYLPASGEVNNFTWDRIVEVYDQLTIDDREETYFKLFPEKIGQIYPGNSSPNIYIIQAVLLTLSNHFSNLGTLQVTGKYDVATQNVVKKIQQISGIETDAVINKKVWNRIFMLYQMFISQDRWADANPNNVLNFETVEDA